MKITSYCAIPRVVALVAYSVQISMKCFLSERKINARDMKICIYTVFYKCPLLVFLLDFICTCLYRGYNNRRVSREVESRRDGLTNISVLSHAVLKQVAERTQRKRTVMRIRIDGTAGLQGFHSCTSSRNEPHLLFNAWNFSRFFAPSN